MIPWHVVGDYWSMISLHKDRFAAYGKIDEQPAEVKSRSLPNIYATYTLCSPVSFGTIKCDPLRRMETCKHYNGCG